MQRQPLASVEAHHDIPLLPPDLITVHREAGAVGLSDLNRPHVAPLGRHSLRRIIPFAGRQRPVTVLLTRITFISFKSTTVAQTFDRPARSHCRSGRCGENRAGERVGECDLPPNRSCRRLLQMSTITSDVSSTPCSSTVVSIRHAGQHRLLAFHLLVDRHRRLNVGNMAME